MTKSDQNQTFYAKKTYETSLAPCVASHSRCYPIAFQCSHSFRSFQQRSADIQKAYHDHFHLTSKVFAYRSFFVIQGGTER